MNLHPPLLQRPVLLMGLLAVMLSLRHTWLCPLQIQQRWRLD
jgi:hypothetical protein